MKTVTIQKIRCGDVYDILEAPDEFASLDTRQISIDDYKFITAAMIDFKAAQAMIRKAMGE